LSNLAQSVQVNKGVNMLYVVPTPIGNLGDITLRALEVLKTSEIILCEDSRQIRKLMTLLQIENKPAFVDLSRNHEFNYTPVFKTLESLQTEDKIVALVSDCGMPGISDPGFEVINLAQKLDISYTVLPGASSPITGAVASNLVSKEFLYLGFLPVKKNRQTTWQKIATSSYPVVVLESVHRLAKFLEEAKKYLAPTAQICLINDISKLHERFIFKTVAEINPEFIATNFKGEWVVVIRNNKILETHVDKKLNEVILRKPKSKTKKYIGILKGKVDLTLTQYIKERKQEAGL
jgi:16S rRNA (cytidine1402-2'-O)-methyltransferase